MTPPSTPAITEGPRGTTHVEVTCPECDGRGFTRVGALEEGSGLARYCDRCDGRGTFQVTA